MHSWFGNKAQPESMKLESNDMEHVSGTSASARGHTGWDLKTREFATSSRAPAKDFCAALTGDLQPGMSSVAETPATDGLDAVMQDGPELPSPAYTELPAMHVLAAEEAEMRSTLSVSLDRCRLSDTLVRCRLPVVRCRDPDHTCV